MTMRADIRFWTIAADKRQMIGTPRWQVIGDAYEVQHCQ
jgi:hypothetical protein